MDQEPDADRLKALEKRLAAARKAQEPPEPSEAMESFGQAQMAWRMIIELVVGIGIGVGLGYGLDQLFGTQPWLLVVFTLLGFAAGVNVMLQSAREMNRVAQKEADDARAGAPAADENERD